jgi:hypothetical protein
MGLDDPLDDGQTQSGALPADAPRLPEPVEQVGYVAGFDPAARIRYPEQNLVTSWCRPDRDTASWRGELQGIADEILEDLKQSVAICQDFTAVRRHIEPKIDRRRGGEWLLGLHELADGRAHLDAYLFDGKSTCLHAGDVEKILDETLHTVRGALDRVGRIR